MGAELLKPSLEDSEETRDGMNVMVAGRRVEWSRMSSRGHAYLYVQKYAA